MKRIFVADLKVGSYGLYIICLGFEIVQMLQIEISVKTKSNSL